MISFLEANALYCIKPSISDCSAKFYIFVGEKENNAMQKSAKLIHKKMQGSSLQVLSQMYHGEFSINHADYYAKKVLKIIKEG